MGKFNFKEINWALILVTFVVMVVATYLVQTLVVEETEDEYGTKTLTKRKLALSLPKKEKTAVEETEEEVGA